MRRTIAGHTFQGLLPAQVCNRCGERYFAGADVGAFEYRTADALLEAGITTGAALQWIRRVLGMPATELAALLDVRPETISRWEHDKRPIDRGSYAVLHQIVRERLEGKTDMRDFLQALRTPKRLKKVIELKGKAA